MASPTFDEMRTRVLARDYGSTADSTAIGGYINEAYEDVCREARWPWLVTSATITLTPSTATFDLSTLATDLQFHGWLRSNSASVRTPVEINFGPNETRWDWFGSATATTGVPQVYARTGERTLIFGPTPDAAYAYTYWYYREPTLLVNNSDEPLMPPADREVLVYGALKRIAERDRDWNAVGYYEQQYVTRLEQMRQRMNAQRRSTTDKVPMPGHYYGEFD